MSSPDVNLYQMMHFLYIYLEEYQALCYLSQRSCGRSNRVVKASIREGGSYSNEAQSPHFLSDRLSDKKLSDKK